MHCNSGGTCSDEMERTVSSWLETGIYHDLVGIFSSDEDKITGGKFNLAEPRTLFSISFVAFVPLCCILVFFQNQEQEPFFSTLKEFIWKFFRWWSAFLAKGRGGGGRERTISEGKHPGI